MSSFVRTGSALLAGTLLSGCLATSQEMLDLRTDITRLEQSLGKADAKQAEFQAALQKNQESLQGNQADLQAQMSALSTRLETLSARLEENDAKMTTLASRLDDLDKNLSGRLDILSEGVNTTKKTAAAAPTKLFQLAYGDFMKRRTAQALKGFQDYLAVYPETVKAAEAQFYVGECHFARKEWKDALSAYDAVIVKYSVSDIVPSAILQKGATLEKMGEADGALAMYETLVKKFPQKPEAESAKARIAALTAPPPAQEPVEAPAPAKPAAKPAPAAPKPAPAPAAPSSPAPARKPAKTRLNPATSPSKTID
jgi:tol-pal system protein YbgF